MFAMLPGAIPVTDLHIEITHLRSTKGLIRMCLTTVPKNFPDCRNVAQAVTRSVPASEKTFTITGVPHGDYAMGVIHDENSNAKLDTFAGIPREGFGFSRNPVIRFGAPSFSAARFTLSGDSDRQEIRMKYML